MILRAAASSDVGRRRRTNEDRYALAPELGLFLVADGMGGHTAGQVASELAARAMVRAVGAAEAAGAAPGERLRQAVARANAEVFQTAQNKPELAGMGTTLVALLGAQRCVGLAHVGDSRAYLVRCGLIHRLTEDHSLVGELVRRREIPAAAAREHPHRHVLTRALGVRRQVEPEVLEVSPERGDVFVLCSDGLTTHVVDHEIAAAVGASSDLQHGCDVLVELANARGGEDNVTVLLVRCGA